MDLKAIMSLGKNKTPVRETRTADGIEYVIERKNINRMHLYVRPPEGSVLVTAPSAYPAGDIDAFVRSKKSWIIKHRERFRERPAQANMSLEYKTGEILYFWGVPYRLEIVEDPDRSRCRIETFPEPESGITTEMIRECRNGVFDRSYAHDCASEIVGAVRLAVPSGSGFDERERAVRRKYKEILDSEAGQVLEYWCRETGLGISSWHSRFMKTRWGSLSVKDKRVCLNTRLAEKPPVCLIYVALHEVAHVKAADHGPVFKAVLDRYLPSWREAEKILKH